MSKMNIACNKIHNYNLLIKNSAVKYQAQRGKIKAKNVLQNPLANTIPTIHPKNKINCITYCIISGLEVQA